MKPVLLIAEAANPEWSSVPLVGWSLATAIARATPAHIVTQVRNRDAFLRHGQVEGRDFTAIDNERIASPVHKIAAFLGGKKGKGWTTTMALNYLAYPAFERRLWARFKDALIAGEYRAVHRVTPLSPTIPSLLARRCHRIGVPFVLGPLNGGLRWPKGYRSVALKEREFLSFIRNIYKILPGRRSTLAHAARIIVGSRATEQDIPTAYRSKCVYMPENGLDPKRFTMRRCRSAARPLQAIFVGRLVPYKGPDIVLEAISASARRGDVALTIVGDGPMRSELEQKVRDLGIQEYVRFEGWVPHTEVQSALAASDIFLFPSVREFGGATPLEAMAVGVPPVVVNYGGPGEIVNQATGWLLEIGDREHLVASLAKVVAEAVAAPETIDRKGEAALRHAWSNFSWEKKAEEILKLYQQLE